MAQGCAPTSGQEEGTRRGTQIPIIRGTAAQRPASPATPRPIHPETRKKPAQVPKSDRGSNVWEIEHESHAEFPKPPRPDWIWEVEQVLGPDPGGFAGPAPPSGAEPRPAPLAWIRAKPAPGFQSARHPASPLWTDSRALNMLGGRDTYAPRSGRTPAPRPPQPKARSAAAESRRRLRHPAAATHAMPTDHRRPPATTTRRHHPATTRCHHLSRSRLARRPPRTGPL